MNVNLVGVVELVVMILVVVKIDKVCAYVINSYLETIGYWMPCIKRKNVHTVLLICIIIIVIIILLLYYYIIILLLLHYYIIIIIY